MKIILFLLHNRQTFSLLGGSPGLVVKGGDSRSEGGGFEPWGCILDGHDIFSHIFVVKICNFCLKRPKISEKEAGVGSFKKTLSLYVKLRSLSYVLSKHLN